MSTKAGLRGINGLQQLKEFKEFDPLNDALEGINLIEASAGTGKTYSISRIYLRLLLEKLLNVDQILVVTFTQAATEELRDRIRKTLSAALRAFSASSHPEGEGDFLSSLVSSHPNPEEGRERLIFALRSFDEAAIYTIHGFCLRVLHENAFESSTLFDTELVTDQQDLIQDVMDDFWRIKTEKCSQLLLPFLIRSTDPLRLARLVQQHISRPLLKILGPGGAKRGCQAECEKAYLSSFSKAERYWSSSQEEIAEILLESDSLNRNKYRREALRQLLDELDQYFNPRRIRPDPPNGFEKLGVSEIKRALKKGHALPGHPFFKLCQELREKADDLLACYEYRLLALQEESFSYAEEELLRRKERLNVRFFDDLLANLYKALQGPNRIRLINAVRSRYRAALIDEFQDTDPVQYEIFKLIYGPVKGPLFLIGDPKQAIYNFRGADLYAYLRASREAQNAFTLSKNWRSEGSLIRAVNTLFSNRADAFLLEEVRFRFARPAASAATGEAATAVNVNSLIRTAGPVSPMQIWLMRSDGGGKQISKTQALKSAVRTTAVRIRMLLEEGQRGELLIGGERLRPADIAVLVRKNSQAREMQVELGRNGIPAVLYSMESLFLSGEALRLFRVLSAIAEYSVEERIRAALTTDFFGLSGEELFRITQDDQERESWMRKFAEYNRVWKSSGFIRMITSLMEREAARVRLVSLPDGQRRITNYIHLIELLHGKCLEKKLGIPGLIKWFADALAGGDGSYDEYQIRLETDEQAVKIVTIHKSKGLEFPVTFCPFLWDVPVQKKRVTVFHDEDGSLVLDLEGGEEHQIRQIREELAENLRLLYVALTRAVNRCYLVWGNIRNAENSGLAYLLHPIDRGDDSGSTIFSKLKIMNDDSIIADLEKLARESGGEIEISSLSAAAADESDVGQASERRSEKKSEKRGWKTERERETADQAARSGTGADKATAAATPPEDRSFRRFRGHIADDWRISSFTALTSTGRSGDGTEEADYDGLLLGYDRGSADDRGIFAFPRGAKAGTFFHSIFEDLDFREADAGNIRTLVARKLKEYGFEASYEADVLSMIVRVLSLPLKGEPDFTLSRLEKRYTLREMEFIFPIDLIDPHKLGAIFRKSAPVFSESSLVEGVEEEGEVREGAVPSMVPELSFSAVRGFIKGFIDLVFRFEDKYFLVDWKSNYLGNRIEDYGSDAIRRTMLEEYYFLQYHLYTLALHRHLLRTLPAYEYEKSFGGVFYIFLRGVDPGRGWEYGLYWDLPSGDLISELDRYLSGGRVC